MRLSLLVKARCGLCEDAYEVVRQVRAALGGVVDTTLEVVDITTDSALMARWRLDVPVLLVDGRPAFRHRVDPERLRARLVDGRAAPLEEDGQAT